MKKSLFVLAAASLLLLSGTAVWAVPTILIDDTQEAVPTVTFSDFATNPAVISGNEWVSIIGSLSGLPDINPKGSYLTEAGVLNPTLADVSDIALFVSVGGNFVVGFASDGATGISFNIPGDGNFNFPTFDEALAAFNVVFPFSDTSVQIETGGYQELFLSNPTNTLSIQAFSDVDIIPLPPSVWLLGSGLLGLVAFRKKFLA